MSNTDPLAQTSKLYRKRKAELLKERADLEANKPTSTNNDEQMAALQADILQILLVRGMNPRDAEIDVMRILDLITTTQAEAVSEALADVAKVSQEHKHAKTYKSDPAYKAGYNAGYTKAWRSRGGLGDGTETPGGKVIKLTNTKDAV